MTEKILKIKTRNGFIEIPESNVEKINRIKNAVKVYKGKDLPLTPPEHPKSLSDEKYEKIWENWFWADFCDFCKSCFEMCKQSWQVDVAYCPRYNPIKKEKES